MRPLARTAATTAKINAGHGASSFAQQAEERGLLKDATEEKENVGHKRSYSPGISDYRVIR